MTTDILPLLQVDLMTFPRDLTLGDDALLCTLPIHEFVYGPKVRLGQVILSGLDLALTTYFAGNCEQDPWPT